MKNPNGFGSCSKAKGKREKPWIARKTVAWEVADDGKVKQVKKTIGYFKTKGEGLKALASYSYNKYEDMTIQQLYEEWSVEYYKRLKASSIPNSRSRYTVHIGKKLADKKVCELKAIDYQELYNSLDVATQTSKNIMSILNMMLDYAVKYDYIQKNYARLIGRKKIEKVIERKSFTQKEIGKFWNCPRGTLADTVLFMIYTGLRVSEMRNLKWEDINLKERHFIVTASKTETGQNRTVPLIDEMIVLLHSQERVSEYVFCGKKKGKLAYSTYWRHFMLLLEELEMEHTIHDCRHTFATLMNKAKADPLALSKILGHKSFKTTAEIYIKVDNDDLKNAVSGLVATS